MSQKRLARARKRLCATTPTEPVVSKRDCRATPQDAALLLTLHVEIGRNRRFPDVCNETKSALQLLRSTFPTDKFSPGFPPVVMKHQLFAMVPTRSDVEKALDMMMEQGIIRTFCLGLHETEMAVVFTEDYVSYVRQCTSSSSLIESFIEKVATPFWDLSYSHAFLTQQLEFQEADISELVRMGLLTPRHEPGQLWIGFPGSTGFTRTLIRGRTALLQTLRRSKHQELPRAQVESSRLPRSTKLRTAYYVYDAIGTGLVVCAKTTCGDILRLRE